MDFHGVFEHGFIRSAGEVNLPDGTEVEFHAVRRAPGAANGSHTSEQLDELDRLSRTKKTIEQLVAEQGTKPIRSIDELRIPGLENEDVDGFLRSIRPGYRP